MKNTIINFWDKFLFEKYSSKGFSLMRITWAALELINFAVQLPSWKFLYSSNGVLGKVECSSVLCSATAFVYSSVFIYILFLILIISLICVLIGYKTRVFIFISLCIITALHDRNTMILNAGDRIERIVGFYLLFANANWLSISSYIQKKKQKMIELKTSIWPYRLLLLQFIAIYFFIAVHKLEGVIWYNGVAIAHSLHVDHFLRFSPDFYNYLSPIYVPLGLMTMIIQLSWGLLLFPKLADIELRFIKFSSTVKQFILLNNMVVHVFIAILMEVDTFSMIMIVGYFGLLKDNDMQKINSIYSAIKTKVIYYLTVTDFAKFRGISGSLPRWTAKK